MFFAMTRQWDKEKILNSYEEADLRALMLYHWATETTVRGAHYEVQIRSSSWLSKKFSFIDAWFNFEIVLNSFWKNIVSLNVIQKWTTSLYEIKDFLVE